MAKSGYLRTSDAIRNRLKILGVFRVDHKPHVTIQAPEISKEPVKQKGSFDLEYTKSDIIRVLALFDSHFPETIRINPLLKFASKFQPDIFILGGDNFSMDCISHWNEKEFRNKGYNNVIDEFNEQCERFIEQITKFMDAAPEAKFVYLCGNHEVWLDDFTSTYPQLQKVTLQTILQKAKRPIELIQRGGFYTVGKLVFAHGDQFGTANPAKQAVERCGKTVVFGHHHTAKIWPNFSMVDEEEKHLGIQVPCYTTLSPEYGKGRPNAWLNGFFTACVKRDSGKFSSFIQFVSPRGSFISQDGTIYE